MKNSLIIITLFFFFGNISCIKNSSEIVYHKSHELKKAKAPFSDVVETNRFLFLAGQVGMDHKTRMLVEGGIEAETKQCLENI
ncbi:MAG: 2-iminobutanoate/2-iminopropanoate deaminase [Psychroserpens sp.]|jgi:2-iminobutanoate/2-iminopropanoate deaminase